MYRRRGYKCRNVRTNQRNIPDYGMIDYESDDKVFRTSSNESLLLFSHYALELDLVIPMTSTAFSWWYGILEARTAKLHLYAAK